VLGGNGNGSSVNNAGSYGYYWSSTYNNANNAYNMNFNSSNIWPQDNNNKNNGFAVRCVKKSEEKENNEKMEQRRSREDVESSFLRKWRETIPNSVIRRNKNEAGNR